MNIPINIMVILIISEIFKGIIVFWVGNRYITMFYLLFHLLPKSIRIIKHLYLFLRYHTYVKHWILKHWILLIIDEELLRRISEDFEVIYDHDDIPRVIFVEFNPYMMIHKERYFKSLSSELYKEVHKHRYFKSIHYYYYLLLSIYLPLVIYKYKNSFMQKLK